MSPPAVSADAAGAPSYGVWGDALRARAWSWRQLGIGTDRGGAV
ncbi:hypothetical protein [Streptomyces sp. NPDC093109]